MKKLLFVLLVATMCLGLCSCGKEHDREMDLLELVENHQFDEAHELLNEMAGEEATKWVPEDYVSDNTVDDSWVYGDTFKDNGVYGDIGEGSDFRNSDDDETQASSSQPEEPTEILVEGIKLSNTELHLEFGEIATLSVSVYPENTTEYVSNIIFESSDSSIVYVNPWDGTVETKGVGTATITASWDDHTTSCVVNVSNPQIETAEELWAIQNFRSGVTYEIVADIDMHGYTFPGYYPEIYGIIEGNGHTIYNVEYKSFLGSVYNGGVIRNLTVECNVFEESDKEYDAIRGGMIVHENNGLIERCVIRGTAELNYDSVEAGGIAYSSRGTIYRCVSEINFEVGGVILNPMGNYRPAYNVRLGGLAYEGNVSECYTLATASFKNDVKGALGGIAYQPYTVEDCYNLIANDSAYGGGICSSNFGEIKNCVNYGKVNAGIVHHHNGYVIDCYYMISKSPARAIDNGAGNADKEDENDGRTRVYGLTDSAVGKQESYPTLDFENVWTMGPDGYPILKWQTEQ